MAKEWEKLEANFKKLQRDIQKYKKDETDKRLKQVRTALDKAWETEDAFVAALKKAMKAGAKGKKPQDFIADDGFKKTMKALKTEMAKHVNEVKSLTDYVKGAKPVYTQLRDLNRDIKKQVTKSDKKQVAFQKEAHDAKEALEHAAHSTGKLNPAETMFGRYFTRVVQNNIDKLNKKNKPAGAGDPAKLIEQKIRDDNEKLAKKRTIKIAEHCNSATKQASSSPKSAQQVLKKAAVLLKSQDELNSSYQSILNKNKDLITKNAEKNKITQVIKKISDHMKVAQSKYDEAEEVLKT